MTANTFFTSDHHFGHANIIGYCQRPFADANEMDGQMLRRWNERVGPEDTVYYLGDFCLQDRRVAPLLAGLNGHKHLIMGNHDSCHPCKKAAALKRGIYYRAGFETLELERTMTIAGQSVLLTHMPYMEAEPAEGGYQPKFAQFRPRNQGGWLVHGHVHEKWKTKDRMINVGVDVWDFYPVPLADIARLISEAGSE